MERILPVLIILLVMGGLTAVMVSWIHENRKLFFRRDWRALNARRGQLFRMLAWLVVGLLIAGAIFGTLYVLAQGGVLSAVDGG